MISQKAVFNYVYRLYAKISRVKSPFGFDPEVTLEEGLTEMMDAFFSLQFSL